MQANSFLLSFLFGLPAFLLSLLLILPVFTSSLWRLAVFAGGYSSFITIAALFGVLCTGISYACGKRGKLIVLGVAMNTTAVIISSIPFLQASVIAKTHSLALSLPQLLSGNKFANTKGNVTLRKDVQFPTFDGKTLGMDIYLPQASTTSHRPLPAVVIVHGGAWKRGQKSALPEFNVWLADEGFVVFDINYRLSGRKIHFPVPVQDVNCAIAFIEQKAESFSVDPDRLALLGRSSGGQLALLAAYSEAGNLTESPSCHTTRPVKAVVSLYGPTDLKWGYEHPCQPDIIKAREVLANYLNGTPDTAPDAYRLASPVNHVNPQCPPTLFLHGGRDQMVHSKHVDMIWV